MGKAAAGAGFFREARSIERWLIVAGGGVRRGFSSVGHITIHGGIRHDDMDRIRECMEGSSQRRAGTRFANSCSVDVLARRLGGPRGHGEKKQEGLDMLKFIFKDTETSHLLEVEFDLFPAIRIERRGEVYIRQDRQNEGIFHVEAPGLNYSALGYCAKAQNGFYPTLVIRNSYARALGE